MLTVADVIKELEVIVEEKGDGYCYDNDPKTRRTREIKKSGGSKIACFYSHYDGTPGCIVGAFIHRMNPDFDLTKVDGGLVRNILNDAGIETEYEAATLLLRCQGAQDLGDTWRQALDQAMERANV